MVNSTIGLRTRVLTAVFLLCSSVSAFAGLSGSPNPNTGDYTISWTAISVTGIDDGYRLFESVNGGATWSQTYYAYGLSRSFANKAFGIYTYKLRRCALVEQWGEPLPQCSDSGFGNITVYVDDPSLPVAAPYHEQLEYEYEVRTGDFDFDGFKDILVERLTPGPIDGSMQTVIIEGGVGGQTLVIPTSSELANARAFPLNSDIKPGGSDQNFDGYVDILLMGLDALNSPAFPYDCLILFASGKSGIAQPLGHQFMDEDYREFFGNTFQAAVDPSFYLNNIQVTLRPEFDFVWDCQWRYGQGWSLYDCTWRIGIVAYTPQVSGFGYHINAPDATDALNAIDSVDYTQGNPWLQLSNAMKNVLGVNSFGYQDDGSRYPTNYKRPGETEADEYGTLRSRLWFGMWRAIFESNAEGVDPQDYDRHVYEVETAICSTVFDTSVAMRAMTGVLGTTGNETIPKEICTVENVFCWAKRNPAPRENGSEATIGDGQTSVLKGGNPIRTHVWDPVFTLVNETLPAGVIAGVEKAHMLNDPLQIGDCAAHSTWGEINDNSWRCAYVHRQVGPSASGSQVLISTHGEGHNAPDNRAYNELGGRQIFNEVDIWIRQQMATVGACTDD